MIDKESPRIYVFQDFILLKEPSTGFLSNPQECIPGFQKSYLINHFNIQFSPKFASSVNSTNCVSPYSAIFCIRLPLSKT
jgi:hypothetical protein